MDPTSRPEAINVEHEQIRKSFYLNYSFDVVNHIMQLFISCTYPFQFYMGTCCNDSENSVFKENKVLKREKSLRNIGRYKDSLQIQEINQFFTVIQNCYLLNNKHILSNISSNWVMRKKVSSKPKKKRKKKKKEKTYLFFNFM